MEPKQIFNAIKGNQEWSHHAYDMSRAKAHQDVKPRCSRTRPLRMALHPTHPPCGLQEAKTAADLAGPYRTSLLSVAWLCTRVAGGAGESPCDVCSPRSTHCARTTKEAKFSYAQNPLIIPGGWKPPCKFALPACSGYLRYSRALPDAGRPQTWTHPPESMVQNARHPVP